MRTEEEVREKFKPYKELMWQGGNLTPYAQGYYFALRYVLGVDKIDQDKDAVCKTKED